ncbi:helix-turn-helix domain-containing protein [Shewanella abyssi]|uniref:helix-turn-helix domain-containing protein n=1 Tax=Shewanella abyssi TaxID=311789 RepID=UPI00200C310C|nr:helix-turn-helix domain-containing protein [Shewanella abyssi]MCL1052160.1 helix-turn-helix domain-containing protein [Shewanella abyssi]
MKNIPTQNNMRYTLNELCQLIELTPRTVRFYIQKALMPAAEGSGRGAFYTQQHLERLLEIKKWQDAGLSLDRISELLFDESDNKPLPPLKRAKAGDIEVCSHIHIDEGITLTLNPSQAGLTPQQAKQLTLEVISLYQRITSSDKEEK